MEYLVDKGALATVLGVEPRTILVYVDEGMPVERRGSKRIAWTFDLRACVQWWGRRGREPGESLDATQERARLAKEQADAQALKNAEMRGELVRGDDVEEWLVRLLGAIAQRVRAIPPKAAPEVRATDSDAEGEALLTHFHDEALSEIADATRDAAATVARLRSRAPAASGGSSRGGDSTSAQADGERVGGRREDAEPRELGGAGAVEDGES